MILKGGKSQPTADIKEFAKTTLPADFATAINRCISLFEKFESRPDLAEYITSRNYNVVMLSLHFAEQLMGDKKLKNRPQYGLANERRAKFDLASMCRQHLNTGLSMKHGDRLNPPFNGKDRYLDSTIQ